MNATATTLTGLLNAFNERLVALQVTDTGKRTAGMNDAKWDDWVILDFAVRADWQVLGERGNTGNEGGWGEAEAAYPQVEWESATDDAIYWDDIEDLQVPENTYTLMRFAVDPARLDAVMELVRQAPLVSDAERADALADARLEANV